MFKYFVALKRAVFLYIISVVDEDNLLGAGVFSDGFGSFTNSVLG